MLLLMWWLLLLLLSLMMCTMDNKDVGMREWERECEYAPMPL